MEPLYRDGCNPDGFSVTETLAGVSALVVFTLSHDPPFTVETKRVKCAVPLAFVMLSACCCLSPPTCATALMEVCDGTRVAAEPDPPVPVPGGIVPEAVTFR